MIINFSFTILERATKENEQAQKAREQSDLASQQQQQVAQNQQKQPEVPKREEKLRVSSSGLTLYARLIDKVEKYEAAARRNLEWELKR